MALIDTLVKTNGGYREAGNRAGRIEVGTLSFRRLRAVPRRSVRGGRLHRLAGVVELEPLADPERDRHDARAEVLR